MSSTSSKRKSAPGGGTNAVRSAGGVAAEKSSNSVVNAGGVGTLADHLDAQHDAAVGVGPRRRRGRCSSARRAGRSRSPRASTPGHARGRQPTYLGRVDVVEQQRRRRRAGPGRRCAAAGWRGRCSASRRSARSASASCPARCGRGPARRWRAACRRATRRRCATTPASGCVPPNSSPTSVNRSATGSCEGALALDVAGVRVVEAGLDRRQQVGGADVAVLGRPGAHGDRARRRARAVPAATAAQRWAGFTAPPCRRVRRARVGRFSPGSRVRVRAVRRRRDLRVHARVHQVAGQHLARLPAAEQPPRRAGLLVDHARAAVRSGQRLAGPDADVLAVGLRVDLEPRLDGLVDHPGEGDVGEPVVGGYWPPTSLCTPANHCSTYLPSDSAHDRRVEAVDGVRAAPLVQRHRVPGRSPRW